MIVLTAVKEHAMSAKAITTQDAPAPVGPYNQAVLAGEWLYCSGQISRSSHRRDGGQRCVAETHRC